LYIYGTRIGFIYETNKRKSVQSTYPNISEHVTGNRKVLFL